MLVSDIDSEVAIRPGRAVFPSLARDPELGLRFASDGYKSRSTRDGKLKRAIGGQLCRFLRRLTANPTPASFRRSSTWFARSVAVT
jgi:hypothetical protein